MENNIILNYKYDLSALTKVMLEGVKEKLGKEV